MAHPDLLLYYGSLYKPHNLPGLVHNYCDTLPQSEVVKVGEEISVSADEDILVIITDATTPEQQQEPDSQIVETPPK